MHCFYNMVCTLVSRYVFVPEDLLKNLTDNCGETCQLYRRIDVEIQEKKLEKYEKSIMKISN